jgi:hypothetical protein
MTASNDKPWHYAVPLVNERTGERRLVVVELSEAERADAMQTMLMHPFELQQGDGDGWPPLVNLYASDRALAGLPPEWSVPCAEIVRIRLH